jgi:hypothetical protein
MSDVSQAFNTLKKALTDDPDYAWSWHCNLAMPMIDGGVEEGLANKCAARLMQHIFSIDTSKHEHYATARGVSG